MRTFLLLTALYTITPQEEMQRARGLYDDAQYADAIAAYDDVLARYDLPPSERREAMLYQGFSHIALRQEDAATRSFRAVLTLEPTFQLPPYMAPKIRALFEQVRKEVIVRPQILARPAEFLAGMAKFSFTLANIHGQKVVVLYRPHGEVGYRELVVTGTRDASATLAVPSPSPDAIEYYAEVRDGMSVVAAAGSSDAPLLLKLSGVSTTSEPALQAATPAYKQWWLWTIVGVVVAGGAATAVYFLTRPAPTTGTLAIHYSVTP